jgi:hypothetical protein
MSARHLDGLGASETTSEESYVPFSHLYESCDPALVVAGVGL